MRLAWSRIAVVCAVGSAAVIAAQFHTLRIKRRRMQERIAYRDRVGEQVRAYVSLSSEREDTLYGGRPEADIERRMGEMLRLSGITPAPAYAVSVQGDRAVREAGGVTGLREQHVSVRLPELPLEQIGVLLGHWRREQRIWTPERIELSHDGRSKINAYSMKLDCVAVYHADGEEER